jgi:hypothetical protein
MGQEDDLGVRKLGALFRSEPAPHAEPLAGLQRLSKAGGAHLAASADLDGPGEHRRLEPPRRVVAGAQWLGLTLGPVCGERDHNTAHALMMNKGCHSGTATVGHYA